MHLPPPISWSVPRQSSSYLWKSSPLHGSCIAEHHVICHQYSFGQLGSAALILSFPSLLPTLSPLSGQGWVRKRGSWHSVSTNQELLKHWCINQHSSGPKTKTQHHKGYYENIDLILTWPSRRLYWSDWKLLSRKTRIREQRL